MCVSIRSTTDNVQEGVAQKPNKKAEVVIMFQSLLLGIYSRSKQFQFLLLHTIITRPVFFRGFLPETLLLEGGGSPTKAAFEVRSEYLFIREITGHRE